MISYPVTDHTFGDQSATEKFTNHQIKASVVVTYIHYSLTKVTKDQLNTDREKFVELQS